MNHEQQSQRPVHHLTLFCSCFRRRDPSRGDFCSKRYNVITTRLEALEAAATAYREAHKKAEAARKPLLAKYAEPQTLKSHELELELIQVRKKALDIQTTMLGGVRAYPKRSQWRKLKELQAQAKDLEPRIKAAHEKESKEWTKHSQAWSEAIKLSNTAIELADELLAVGLGVIDEAREPYTKK